MEKNKKLILSVCLLFSGVIGSGLFAIGQSIVILSRTNGLTSYNNQNVCGVLCFIFLIVAIAGLIIMLTEMMNKKENK
jgi:hypothetical protein